MAYERDMRGTWKVQNPGTKIKHNYVIGMIYIADNVVGMLVEDLGQQVILETKTKQRVQVSKQNLKILINE